MGSGKIWWVLGGSRLGTAKEQGVSRTEDVFLNGCKHIDTKGDFKLVLLALEPATGGL